MILVLLSEILLHISDMEGIPSGFMTLILDHLERGAIGSSDGAFLGTYRRHRRA